MSDAKANGAAVLGGVISEPRGGAWRAELDVDLDDATKVTGDVEIEVGGVVWRGTSIEVGAYGGRTKLRAVGGKAGLGKPTKPRFYRTMPARTVAVDALGDGGEALSDTSDAATLGTILPLWTRADGIVSEALEQLLDELDATWRVLRDGTVWIGNETWPTVTDKTAIVIDDVPSEARMTIATEAPVVTPGSTFLERRVSRVETRIAPDSVRSSLWFDSGDAGGDVVRVAFERIVRQATKHFDYYATYSGKVVAQNGDGTLELRLDSPRLPGMSRIPIRAGAMTLKVKGGAEVNVVFLNGSPAKPCVTYVDPKALLEASLDPAVKVTVNAVQVVTQNGRPLARVGDMVQVISTPPGTPAIGQIMTGNNLHRG